MCRIKCIVHCLLHAVEKLQNEVEELLRPSTQSSDIGSLEVHDDLETYYSVVLVFCPDELEAFVHYSDAVRLGGIDRIHW